MKRIKHDKLRVEYITEEVPDNKKPQEQHHKTTSNEKQNINKVFFGAEIQNADKKLDDKNIGTKYIRKKIYIQEVNGIMGLFGLILGTIGGLSGMIVNSLKDAFSHKDAQQDLPHTAVKKYKNSDTLNSNHKQIQHQKYKIPQNNKQSVETAINNKISINNAHAITPTKIISNVDMTQNKTDKKRS